MNDKKLLHQGVLSDGGLMFICLWIYSAGSIHMQWKSEAFMVIVVSYVVTKQLYWQTRNLFLLITTFYTYIGSLIRVSRRHIGVYLAQYGLNKQLVLVMWCKIVITIVHCYSIKAHVVIMKLDY